MKFLRLPLMALPLLAFLTPSMTGADAGALARCAGHSGVEVKLAACAEASRSTPYPWILHWVHRELARAHRDGGDVPSALASYARSLAAAENAVVRREMEELISLLTQ